jgi:uncharacterized protein YggE
MECSIEFRKTNHFKMKNTLLLAVVILLISCDKNGSKTDTTPKIEVTGSAEMEIVPDEIYVSFTLIEYLDANKTKVKLDGIKSDFLSQCKAAGVDDSEITISGYSGTERWDYYWSKKHKTDPDFKRSINYVIRVSSPEKLDKIVNGLNEQAIEDFEILKRSHSRIEELRKEVKTNALIASKNKADYLAESIGQELGNALLIEEIEDNYRSSYSNSSYSNTVSQAATSYGGSNSSSPDFEKIKLRYEMRVAFELK